jgi:hypothetical protein
MHYQVTVVTEFGGFALTPGDQAISDLRLAAVENVHALHAGSARDGAARSLRLRRTNTRRPARRVASTPAFGMAASSIDGAPACTAAGR